MEEIASVYARSLFEVAQEQGKLDEVREQLGEFADALDENQEMQVFFFSPYFSTQEKEEGLDKVVTDAEPILQNFLKLLIEKHRMPAVFRVRRTFDEMWQRENRLLPVETASASRRTRRSTSPPGSSPASSAGSSSASATPSSTRRSAHASNNFVNKSQ